MSDEKFQVSLGGIIELLSDHLYSTPLVFVRELIQNAVDAITARRKLESSFQGAVHIEYTEGQGSGASTLSILDNGVGLSLDDVHKFLATIGNSSKRSDIDADDFIGQFGIGLLSCFVVTDEITLITRSVNNHSKAVEWRGRSDGFYSVKEIDADIAPGTQVFLRANESSSELFTPEILFPAVRHYGKHLPIAIAIEGEGDLEKVNRLAPWEMPCTHNDDSKPALLAYAQEEFDIQFLDAFPITSRAGKVNGVAYVLPFSSSSPQHQPHQVYLKGMLLSEKASDLLPPWAFFVRCVVNAESLRPTASRESLFADATLASARESLGKCVRAYLLNLVENEPEIWDRLLAVHYRAIKSLAADDDEFYRLVIDWLPFETSFGRLTLAECLANDPVIRYSPTYDQFGQIASVAAAQKICVVNAGYAFDLELIEKLSAVHPDRQTREVGIDELAEAFEDLPVKDSVGTADFVKLANLVLHPYGCSALVHRFNPTDLPALYTTNESAGFLRSIQGAKEFSDDIWGSVLDAVSEKPNASAQVQLMFNYDNRLVRRLIDCDDVDLVGRVIQLLYVQAMILGRHPLRPNETALLSDGLLDLIESAIGGRNVE